MCYLLHVISHTQTCENNKGPSCKHVNGVFTCAGQPCIFFFGICVCVNCAHLLNVIMKQVRGMLFCQKGAPACHVWCSWWISRQIFHFYSLNVLSKLGETISSCCQTFFGLFVKSISVLQYSRMYLWQRCNLAMQRTANVICLPNFSFLETNNL